MGNTGRKYNSLHRVKQEMIPLSTFLSLVGRPQVGLYSFLTSSRDGDEDSTSRPSRFNPRERNSLNRIIGGSHSWSERFGEETSLL